MLILYLVPCILVGICTEHLDSHQNGLVLVHVEGELLIHELLNALRLTQVDLGGGGGGGEERKRGEEWRGNCSEMKCLKVSLYQASIQAYRLAESVT